MGRQTTIAIVAGFAAAIFLTPLGLSGQELPRFAAGAKVSSLGYGFEGTTALTENSNLRGGFNFFNFNRGYDNDGIHYDGNLHFRSVQVTYDQYLYSGFHVSPGLLLYNGNKVSSTASVPAGQSFSLGDTTYYSGQTNPISGLASLDLGRKVSPLLMVGAGNPLPRNGRRLGFTVDFGVAFQGSPKSMLGIAGTACTVSPTTGCLNAATDPTVQSNVLKEQSQLDDDLKELRYYPILSFGISWRLK